MVLAIALAVSISLSYVSMADERSADAAQEDDGAHFYRGIRRQKISASLRR
jgi:hypothetical protein